MPVFRSIEPYRVGGIEIVLFGHPVRIGVLHKLCSFRCGLIIQILEVIVYGIFVAVGSFRCPYGHLFRESHAAADKPEMHVIGIGVQPESSPPAGIPVILRKTVFSLDVVDLSHSGVIPDVILPECESCIGPVIYIVLDVLDPLDFRSVDIVYHQSVSCPLHEYTHHRGTVALDHSICIGLGHGFIEYKCSSSPVICHIGVCDILQLLQGYSLPCQRLLLQSCLQIIAVIRVGRRLLPDLHMIHYFLRCPLCGQGLLPIQGASELELRIPVVPSFQGISVSRGGHLFSVLAVWYELRVHIHAALGVEKQPRTL